MGRTHFIAVGACAIDKILTVPYFPEEDTKLRALSLTTRRGGNCPNTLEVLSQLVDKFVVHDDDSATSLPKDEDPLTSKPKLALIATLPSRSSPQIPFIKSSFDVKDNDLEADKTTKDEPEDLVDLSKCIHREAFMDPITSYIICSQAASSRTIVNHNELPEMTLDEFINATSEIMEENGSDQFWFHFEGRIPDTTLKCIQYLRSLFSILEAGEDIRLRISVELEKPKREGLQELAYEADVIFYSKSWAEAEGYESGEVCLRKQAVLLINKGSRSQCQTTLVCTWGDLGASALQLQPRGNDALTEPGQEIQYSPAYTRENTSAVDTVGAGDTFIAGMLFSFICRDQHRFTSDSSSGIATTVTSSGQPVWSLKQGLDFANELAGRKVLQYGFRGLSEQLLGLVRNLDHATQRADA